MKLLRFNLAVLTLVSVNVGLALENQEQKGSGGVRIVNNSDMRLHFFTITSGWRDWESNVDGAEPTVFFFGTVEASGVSMWVPIPKTRASLGLETFAWISKELKTHTGFSYEEDIPEIKRGQWVEYLINSNGGGSGLRIVDKPFETERRIPGTLGNTRILQMRGKADEIDSVDEEWQRLLYLARLESKFRRCMSVKMPGPWYLGYYGSALEHVDFRTTIFGKEEMTGYRARLATRWRGDQFNKFFNMGYDVGTWARRSKN